MINLYRMINKLKIIDITPTNILYKYIYDIYLLEYLIIFKRIFLLTKIRRWL